MLRICCFWRSVLWKLLSVMRPQIEKIWSFGATHSAVGIHWAIRISDMRVQYNFFPLHPFLSFLSHSIPLFSPFLSFFTGTPAHAELMNAVLMNLYCFTAVLVICLAITVLKVFRSPDSCTYCCCSNALDYLLLKSITVRLISVWVTLHERVWLYLNIINPKCTKNPKIVSFFPHLPRIN